MKSGADIAKFLMQLQVQFKICHWQTMSYAQHQAFGMVYDTLDGLTDEFMEVFMGKYGRFDLMEGCSLPITNYDQDGLEPFLDSAIISLNNLSGLLSENDSDLLNIRDEMLAGINKLKYLLTLK